MTASPEHAATKHRAQELKDRNRGSIDQWLFSGYDDSNFESPRPKPRTNTNEAKEYAQRDQGSLREVMAMTPEGQLSPKHGNTPRKVGPPVSRCPTDECRQNMNRNDGQGMRGVFGMNGSEKSSTNGEPESPTKSRTRPEAQAYAERNKGSMDLCFGAGEGDGGSAAAKARVKTEGSRYAERNKGTLTQQMYNYGNGERTPPPQRRLTGEARDNKALAAGTGIKDCFHHNPEWVKVLTLSLISAGSYRGGFKLGWP